MTTAVIKNQGSIPHAPIGTLNRGVDRGRGLSVPTPPFTATPASVQGTMKSPFSLIKITVCLCLALFLLSCSGKQVRGDSKGIGYAESGQASFYAMKYHSRKTASGERLDQYAFTAAHRTLPFGTKVKVTNLENGKSVTVKINDRGPFVKGRVIDLTQAAFKKIGDTGSGLIDVRIVVVE